MGARRWITAAAIFAAAPAVAGLLRKRLSGTTERPRLNVFRSLENIFVQVIDDETLWQQFIQAAGKKAEAFDIRLQTEKLVNVYHQAIEDKKANLAVQVEPPDFMRDKPL